MNFEKIRYSISDKVANIVLDSQKNMNALDELMIDDLSKALEMSKDDDSIGAVVISGNGKCFSAGGDIGTMYRCIKEGKIDLGEAIMKLGRLSMDIKRFPKPVIASLHGAVAGAGFNIALACDFRIAADKAKFIQSFVKIGLVPDAGGIFLLTRAIGVAKATELVMSGNAIEAGAAFELGFVNKMVSLEELENETKKLAKKLAAGPSLSYSGMKDLIFESEYKYFESYIEKEVQRQVECMDSEDFKEGIFAFVEKRKPEFTGS